MDYLMLALRLTHIFAGVFWAGATLTTAVFLKPPAGEDSRQTTQRSATRARLTSAMTRAAVLTVLAGYAMYWIDSDGFSSPWMHSGPGLGFALGGACGLLGLIARLWADRDLAAWTRLASGNESPIVEADASLDRFRRRQAALDALNAGLLMAAVLFMAAARYLAF